MNKISVRQPSTKINQKPSTKRSTLHKSSKSIATKKKPVKASSTSASSLSPIHIISAQSITTTTSCFNNTPTDQFLPQSAPQFYPSHHAATSTSIKSATPFTTARRFKRKKTYFITGPYFDQCNESHPIPEGSLYYIDNIPLSAQFRNQYKRNINVPCLLSTEDQRTKQTSTIHKTNNRILNTLRDKIAEADKKGKKFYLVDLPMTPDYSLEPNKLYSTDPDEYNLPSNKYLQENNANQGWGQVLEVKTDMLENWLIQNPGKPIDKFSTRAQGDQIAGAQTNRVSMLIQNRLKNPDLYHTFGLDENVYQTRLTMYAIHVWLYCRAVQYRPVHNSEAYRKALLTVLDNTSQSALYYDFKFHNSKDRHSMIQLLLPWYRTFMINMDKAFTSLAGGDPEPMYGLLYRTLYRTSEPDRIDPKKTASLVEKESLRGYPYSPDVEVFMLDPPSLTHINTLINFIVNASFDMHTKSPRDFNLVLNGFIDMIDWPTMKTKTPSTTTTADVASSAIAPSPSIPEPDYPTCPEPTTAAPSDEQQLSTPKINPIRSEAEQPGKPQIDLHKGRSLLKPLSRDEQMRWAYPVFQAQKSPFMPGFFKRMAAIFSPEKMETSNWFLNPQDQSQPAWRPPQFSLTESGRIPES